MKRKSNLYQSIISLDNLRLADSKAQKAKQDQLSVIEHNEKAEANIQLLHELLRDKQYRTSEYTRFKIYEPKEREIFRLPYFPDRIAHHAIMNILEPIFVDCFIGQTYSCIKKRGINGAAKAIREALKDIPGTTYCLKIDVKKFYPSVDHDTLKQLLRRKFKDSDLIWLMDEIIDSVEGLPIGNYLSQYFANFYLSGFDHWMKQTKGVKHYFRYADDIVILSDNKPSLHSLLTEIKLYLDNNLKLQVKSNHQVFPVDKRGIDFVGYVFYHTHIRLRKTIKQNFAKMMAKRPNHKSIASYNGWLNHCNSKTLKRKILHEKV